MNVRIGRSKKMPVLNSYFITKFDEEVLEHVKSRRPFSFYHRAEQEYEITEEVYREIETPFDVITDERQDYKEFIRWNKDEKYGYQKDAVLFARNVDNMLVNFPQGTGKSRTSMMIIDDQEFHKTLIICGQSNLQEEWIKDAQKHGFAEKLNFNIIGETTDTSSARKANWILEHQNEKGVDIINIEALRNQRILDAINEVKYNCLIIDEVQSAKGWRARQTEGLHSIEEVYGQMRIALSGTPILNGPFEFFSVLRFLRQLKDTARTTYENYYGIWGLNFWGHYENRGFRNLEDLQELLKPIIVYMNKDELNLPEKKRYKIELEDPKTPELVELEKAYRMTTARLKRAGYTSKPQIKSMIQQLTSSADAKVNYILENFKDKRILLFSQYTEALKAVQSQLESKGKKVLLYTGELSMAARLEILDKWRTEHYDVLLLSVMAARYGLNLIEATDVVYLEPPQNLAVLEQTEDRAHRIGQTSPVNSYLLVWGEGDENRLENIVNKQEAIEKIYDFLK